MCIPRLSSARTQVCETFASVTKISNVKMCRRTARRRSETIDGIRRREALRGFLGRVTRPAKVFAKMMQRRLWSARLEKRKSRNPSIGNASPIPEEASDKTELGMNAIYKARLRLLSDTRVSAGKDVRYQT